MSTREKNQNDYETSILINENETNLVNDNKIRIYAHVFVIIVLLSLIVGSIFFLSTTTWRINEDFPTIYNKKEVITVYNSSGRYVNITLCQKDTDNNTQQCTVYVCEVCQRPSGSPYSITYLWSHCHDPSFDDKRVGDKMKVHYIDSMVVNNQVSCYRFRCTYCNTYLRPSLWITISVLILSSALLTGFLIYIIKS